MTTVEEVLGRSETSSTGRADRVAVRTFRPYRSWAALVAGGLLVTVTGLAAAEVISALVGSPLSLLPVDRTAEYTSGARWSDPAVQVASAVLVLVSLLLIALALVPGWGRGMAWHPHDPAFVAGVSRATLRRTLAAAAREVDGVRDARVTLTRRRVKVRVDTETHRAAELSSAIQQAVEHKIVELSLVREPRVRVQVHHTRG
ncbi:hypothetical protein NI17_014655 [Thermobifida halotolerans]|uniref:DUF6286 domain-containing protein n=1 Tax=Thermobifida halotolerans TaxID=483545 RepID=A0A399FZH3_9ACTN|nr:DUF6286 domain-containing protein [Thermobifida halotolerans]UOE18089.1 hypothetical protein NI17_014655 [Thermobifida halotolerans]